MADIKRYPLARHLRGNPTMHVRHLRRGKAAHEGTGLSFFFRPLSAVLSEVPVDDRETDPKTAAEIDVADVAAGIRTINEVRAARGLAPLPDR